MYQKRDKRETVVVTVFLHTRIVLLFIKTRNHLTVNIFYLQKIVFEKFEKLNSVIILAAMLS